jgi:regulator of cell morphogenesis and NO signaling
MPPGKRTVGEIVAADYRAAQVFDKKGVDYCCGGNITLAEACKEKGLDLAAVTNDLEAVKDKPADRNQNYSSWEIPFLADYIINIHHAYLKENTAPITAYTQKIAHVHGGRHPELVEIAAIFKKIERDMAGHLKEEEEVFFPAIKQAQASSQAGAVPGNLLQTIKASLRKLAGDHVEIGDAAHKIRHLANDFAIPDDVCNTFVVAYQKLKEFEEDLHKHVHLENNILFIKTEQLLE